MRRLVGLLRLTRNGDTDARAGIPSVRFADYDRSGEVVTHCSRKDCTYAARPLRLRILSTRWRGSLSSRPGLAYCGIAPGRGCTCARVRTGAFARRAVRAARRDPPRDACRRPRRLEMLWVPSVQGAGSTTARLCAPAAGCACELRCGPPPGPPTSGPGPAFAGAAVGLTLLDLRSLIRQTVPPLQRPASGSRDRQENPPCRRSFVM